jgi:hypothetical protein
MRASSARARIKSSLSAHDCPPILQAGKPKALYIR